MWVAVGTDRTSTQSPFTFKHRYHCGNKVCVQSYNKLNPRCLWTVEDSFLHAGFRCKSPVIQVLLKQSRETEITSPHTANRSHDLVQRYRLVAKKTRPKIPISHPAVSITFYPLRGSGAPSHPPIQWVQENFPAGKAAGACS